MDASSPFLSAQGSGQEFLVLAILLVWVAVGLGFLALTILVWWRIFAKTGHPGALGLLMLVPIANLAMLLVLAFGQWPIHREIARLRAAAGMGPGEAWREFR